MHTFFFCSACSKMIQKKIKVMKSFLIRIARVRGNTLFFSLCSPFFFKFWYRLLIFGFAFLLFFLYICFHFNRKLPSEKYSKTLWSKTLFCRRWGKTFTGKIGWTSLLQFYVEIVFFYPKSSLLSSFSSTGNAHFCYLDLARELWVKNIVPYV
jgi:hypothetical protein